LIYLGFITKGKFVAVLITPSLGVLNWSVIYIINTAPSVRWSIGPTEVSPVAKHNIEKEIEIKRHVFY
jgi:hypothetical protein